MKKSISKKKKTSLQEATVYNTRAQGTAAILTAIMPWVMLITFLAFIVFAPQLGVDLKSLQPEFIAPIIASFLKQ
ncbi:hypothetical protein [Robertmurraya sp. FSL R5-0851]|uniref:hypothetical protein n=1 Tax=Robertmurraya sp. FSL R5-0851 TaxID=2921584 RepID=UPI0030FC847F